MDISVIIPYCNEYPQVIFTIQAMIEELQGQCRYEIIAVDNKSDDKSRKFFKNDETGKGLNTWFVRKKILKYIRYDDKLSHWNAKNAGIKASVGKYLFFLDSHCIMKRDSIITTGIGLSEKGD